MDLSPKKMYLHAAKHHHKDFIPSEKSKTKMKDGQHERKSKPDFPAKTGVKQLFSKKVSGLLSGGRVSVSPRSGAGQSLGRQLAVKRGDLHSLLALQSRPSIETLLKMIEKDSSKTHKKKKRKGESRNKSPTMIQEKNDSK